jgi:carbamoyl-phosphate synthase large subunit
MMNVMFTSVGRRTELLQAFRRSYQSLNLRGNIVATDVDPLAPAFQVADKTYIVPPFHDLNYVPTLIEICRRERIDLVFPLIDPDIPVLAEAKLRFERLGARTVVVPTRAAEIAADKWKTIEFFRDLGLRVPHSWLPGEIFPNSTEYPLFIKPRDGSAGIQSYVVYDRGELEFYLARVRRPLIQEYLPGPEITTDILSSLDSELLGIVSRLRLEVRWGEVAKGVTILDKRILEACKLISHRLPSIGPITVQCMMKEGTPHFTEINARFGGGAPLGFAAGMDSPKWILARAAGIPVEIAPIGEYVVGLHLTRCDHSYFIDSLEVAKLASHTVRPG